MVNWYAVDWLEVALLSAVAAVLLVAVAAILGIAGNMGAIAGHVAGQGPRRGRYR
jgi:hypothetical protein